MSRVWIWPIVLGSLLPAASTVTARAPGAEAVQAGEPATPEDREVQALLEKMSNLSDQIAQNTQSPQLWQYELQQGELMLQMAAHSKTADERDKWLRLAIDAHFGAAVISPANDLTALQRLAQLPMQITLAYPGNRLCTYAALQEVQADYTRALNQADGDLPKAQDYLGQRLLRFAQEYPDATEAPKAVWDAAQLYDGLKKPEETRRCYRYLVEHFATHAIGRKAEGALWRMQAEGQTIQLSLPLLYTQSNIVEPPFDLGDLRGKLVVVYFWSSACSQAGEDFEILKRLSQRYQRYGLEMVHVNLDKDPAQARAFLSGRLTTGTHLSDKSGLDGRLAERYGVQSLPQAFLLGMDGTLIQHSLQAGQIEPLLTSRMPHAH
jgi:hypothetical protein